MDRRRFIQSAAGVWFASSALAAPARAVFPGLLASHPPLLPPMANLQVWLKTPIDGASDQSVIAAWADSSGNGNGVTSGNGPKYQTVSNKINGVPTLFFNIGIGNRMDNAGLNTSAWTQGTLVQVAFLTNDTPGGNGYSHWTFQGDTVNKSHYPAGDNNIYDGAFSTTRRNMGDPASSLVNPHAYVLTSIAGAYTSYIDGVQLFTDATNTFLGFASGYTIGRGTQGTDVAFNGYISEILVYDAALTGAPLAALHAYLKTRYAL